MKCVLQMSQLDLWPGNEEERKCSQSTGSTENLPVYSARLFHLAHSRVSSSSDKLVIILTCLSRFGTTWYHFQEKNRTKSTIKGHKIVFRKYIGNTSVRGMTFTPVGLLLLVTGTINTKASNSTSSFINPQCVPAPDKSLRRQQMSHLTKKKKASGQKVFISLSKLLCGSHAEAREQKDK